VAKTPKKTKTPTRPLISKEAEALAVKDGKVTKAKNGANPRPIAKKKQEAIKAARMALATGKIASEEQERKLASDLRTLYVRFKADVPSDEGQIRQRLDNHPEIKFIRIPRQNQKNIRYAFVEFGSEAQCEKAKETLTTGPKAKDGLYIDYVGVKSKQGGKPAAEKSKRGKRPINPTRLFIKGLVEGLNEEKLKQLFPKAIQTSIPKMAVRKGSKFGYVQFENPADAKAAFDASQKLTISASGSGSEGHHLTVTYAQQSKKAVKAAKQQSSKSKSSSSGSEAEKSSKKKTKKEADKKKNEDVKKEEVKEEEEAEETKEESEEEQDEDNDESNDEKAKKEEEEEEDDDDEEEEEEEEDDDDENMENDAESSDEEEG